ncbi:MAG: hypothetical protein FJ100_19905 [Deltaproteobacteria bacterium]|nr:hypothetical protein [Deltaproteobacteria bacterium]
MYHRHDDASVRAVAAQPGGFVTATRGDLVRYDHAGNVLWTRKPTTADGCSIYYAIAPLADGGLVTAGAKLSAGTWSACLARRDAWGNPTCASSGQCVDKTAAQCSAANP